jgi:hypothetical protein
MTGTNCDLFTHKSSRSCLNHLVYNILYFLMYDNSTLYRVSWGECVKLWENVPWVKLHQWNQKHLYPKLNSYRDNDERKFGLFVVLLAVSI